MYDIKMLDNEKIKLINDNVELVVYEETKKYTVIITNIRLLILDFPDSIKNSNEDLRISQRLYYIKKKEIIFDIKLEEIKKIVKDDKFIKIYISNEEYLLIKNNKNSRNIMENMEKTL